MSFSVDQICEWISGKVVNANALSRSADSIVIRNLSPLAQARDQDLAFFFNPQYQNDLLQSRAGVLITGNPFVKPLEASGIPQWKSSAVIATADPYYAMAVLSKHFAKDLSSVAHCERSQESTIHPTSVVHPSATIGAGVSIGAHSVIEEGVVIGAGSVIYPGCFLGSKVSVGENCVLFPRVTLYEWTQIGNRVRIHAGSVIGADGFGYAPVREGDQVVDHQKIYHLGKVIVGDDVEIGANSCVDRGTLSDTIIESKAKIDNQVQLGHNVHIHEGAIICGTTGIAGSSSVGKFAYVGGMVGIANKVHIGDRANVGGCSLVSKDVPEGETYVGNPAREKNKHFRLHAMLNRMLAEKNKKKGSNG